MADSSKQSFLNSLFQWTVKNTASEPTPITNVEPMTEDKKKWLNAALENVTINPVDRLKICISKIKDKETKEQEKKEFFGELCHWAEELDLAKDFFTIGGLDILSSSLESTNDDIAIQTCSLLATLVQNNEYCQRIIVQSGLQEKLLKIVSESDNSDLKTKAVTAISALVRGYTLGQLQLQKYHGPKILIQAISSPIPRLQNKLCFLINTICSSSAHMKKIFYENGALVEFVRLFNSEACPDHQHTLETILTFSSAKPNALSSLTQSHSSLVEEFQQKLTDRCELIQDSEDHLDEINIINQIRTLLNSSPTDANPVAETTNNKQVVSIS